MKWTIPLAALAACAPALACIHPPKEYAGSAQQGAQEAIVFWHQGREELVIKNDFRIVPGPGGELPTHLAWVVPVPSAPDHYSVEDVEIFRVLFQAFEERIARDTRGGSKGLPNGGIERLEAVSVGEYDVQPIRATGEEGARALSEWLAANGFGEIPEALSAWYVERGWVWLAIKVSAARGQESITRNGSLRPLRVSFATPDIVYPVLFSGASGAFDVSLYLVTEERIAALGDVSAFGFEIEAAAEMDLPDEVEAIQRRAQGEGAWQPIESPVVTQVVGHGVNGAGNPLAAWKQDFRISMSAPAGKGR